MAIKYLRQGLLADPGFAGVFRGEVAALASVDDPNVVRLYDYVEAPGGAAIVMELVDGVTLASILGRFGATSPEAALAVLHGSLLGLAAAHARGVVHRDYKPGNVLVRPDGVSKLTDFGIAARTGERPLPAGTLAYVAPEQIAGAPASPAGDVFSATATFYECLTGTPPFAGARTVEQLAQAHAWPAPLDAVPEPLRPVVSFGLARDPDRRPADAAALAARLYQAAAAAYGSDWAQRGWYQLGRAAVALAALWPSALAQAAGSAAGSGSTAVTSPRQPPSAPHHAPPRTPAAHAGPHAPAARGVAQGPHPGTHGGGPRTGQPGGAARQGSRRGGPTGRFSSAKLIAGGTAVVVAVLGGVVLATQRPAVISHLPGGSSGALTAVADQITSTCAIRSGGSLFCWGPNNTGQLGLGQAVGPAPCKSPSPPTPVGCTGTPARVTGLPAVTAVSTSGATTCAVGVDRRAYCWGLNSFGGLGNGATQSPGACGGLPCSTRPVPVTGLANVADISVGLEVTCAVTQGGAVYCWGSGTSLGTGTGTGPSACPAGAAAAKCATTPVAVPGLSGVKQVAAGINNACALRADGTVVCWGGYLGPNGPDTCPGALGACLRSPTLVAGLAGVRQISVGMITACALLADGTVDCWGDNAEGQLGMGSVGGPEQCPGVIGTEACSGKPERVSGLTRATSVTVGSEHACATTSGGAVWCWGANNGGQLGIGSSSGPDACHFIITSDVTDACASVPQQVEGLPHVLEVAAGNDSSCALDTTAHLWCWGVSYSGGIGNGPTSLAGNAQCHEYGATPPLSFSCQTLPVRQRG